MKMGDLLHCWRLSNGGSLQSSEVLVSLYRSSNEHRELD